MVLSILSPSKWKGISPRTRIAQEQLQAELDKLQLHFPDAKKKDLKRFLMGSGMKADKAILAYEEHLRW